MGTVAVASAFTETPDRASEQEPPHDHQRHPVELLRTGAPWRDLPEQYGSWKTVSSRFYRWRSAGIWQQILKKLQQQADAQGNLDWVSHYVDSIVVRAHQHAARAKGGSKRRHWIEVVVGSVPRRTCVPKGRASH